MRILILIFYLFSIPSYAGVANEITPEQVTDMGVEVVLWHEYKNSEIKEAQEYLSCTPVTVFFPLIDSKKPNFTRAKTSGTLNLNGRLLAQLDVSVNKTKDGKRNYAQACVPLGSEYEVNITYSFNPKDEEVILFCPPAYVLKDIKRFINTEDIK